MLLAVALALPLLAWYLGGRVPPSHDGLQVLTLQYFFLDEALQTGEVGLWLPFMTHGTVSNWWLTIQSGMLQVAGQLAPWLVPVRDILAWFYMGFYLDMLMLLAGTWLLARRLFRTAEAAWMTTASVCGGVVWLAQPWYSLRVFFTLPLILWLFHRWIDEGRWRYAAAAGNLLALQIMGSLPYCLPVTSAVAFTYAATYVAFHGFWFRRGVAVLARRWVRGLAATVLVLGTLWICYQVLTLGTESVAFYNRGRDADGLVSVSGFLRYASDGGPRRWFELLVGVPIRLDYTVYLGALALPAALYGMTWSEPVARSLTLAFVLVLMLSLGTFVSEVYFHLWPAMKFYRHIVLVTCYARLLLAFLAGVGAERLVLEMDDPERRPVTLLLGLSGFFTFASLAALVSPVAVLDVLMAQEHILDSLPVNLRAVPSYPYLVGRTALFSLLVSALLLVRFTRSRALTHGLFRALLVVHGLDLATYHWMAGSTFAQAVPPECLELLQLGGHRYAPRRLGPDDTTARGQLFEKAFPRYPNVGWGAPYWSTDGFLHRDAAFHTHRTDHWLLAIDDLIKAATHQPLRRFDQPVTGHFPGRKLRIPLDEAWVRDVMGIDRDKIQGFSRASLLDAPGDVAARLRASERGADHLWLLDDLGRLEGRRPGAPLMDPGGESSSVPLGYEVVEFSANHLRLRLDPPPQEPTWLVYADAWHPGWTSTTDGASTPVLRAQLGYKAVAVPAGARTVDFRFRNRPLEWRYLLLSLNLVGWLLALPALLVLAARSPADADLGP